MRPPRAKPLLFPVIGLLAAVTVLLAVVTVTTYYNLDRGGEQAERILAAQGSAIVSGLAAGLRTGWVHWVWRSDSLQGLVDHMSQTGDVAFIALLDRKGLVLAHSNPILVGRVYTRLDDTLSHLNTDQVSGWFDEHHLYLSGRILGPRDLRVPSRRGMGMMRDLSDAPRPEVILVGLKTEAYLAARQRQLTHALVMAGLLFVLGSGAIYFIFVVQNYRTIERTLADLSTYTANIVDNMPNGLITVDAPGEPIMINRAARDMFGMGNRSEKDLSADPAVRALWERFSGRIGASRQILEEEFDAPAPDGGVVPLAVSAAAVPAGTIGETGPGAVFILRDLRQIRDLEEQVRRGEKLAAVGRLAAGVAHEVRNPLSSMRGLANFLARGLDGQSREAEYLKVMIEEIDRLDRVISGLLDFARPREPELTRVSLNDVARHTSDLITDDVRHKRLSLREDMSPKKPLVLADRDQAIQAMLNILLNAVEATPEGGRMTVSTTIEGEFGVFAVEDSGEGISPGDRSRLFDPFFTTKKKGTGLGLAQVAGIMEAHHGRVEIGNEPGLGTRAALYFPLTDDPEAT
ncbi:MAG: PAS domain S-box protein [Proteobacteria bacterium]|nr:PAS domain S-box protein [Pseudomonadota bacterium]